MAKITLDLIKKLREQSGVGISDCKEALEESKGDLEKAYENLRKKGMAKLLKRSDKTASYGYIGTYSHGGQIVALAVLKCETDFVARGGDFQELAKEIAMQVAAQDPEYINIENIPEDIIEKEKSIYVEEIKKQGKPNNIAEKIALGKLQKFYEEVVLMEQVWIKDDSKKIKDVFNEYAAKIGEKIQISNIYRITL